MSEPTDGNWRNEYLRTPHWQVVLENHVLGQTPTFRQAGALAVASLALSGKLTTESEITATGIGLHVINIASPQRPICGPILAPIIAELCIITPDMDTQQIWEVIVGNPTGADATFKAACRRIIERINTLINADKMSAQLLWEFAWIGLKDATLPPVYFGEAKDIAAEEDWQKKGVWQE